MNLKRIFWSVLTLIAGCLAFAACSSDADSIDPDKAYRPGKDFVFSVSMDSYNRLRATYEESQKEEYKEESAIKSLYLFVLDGNSDNSHILFKSKADNLKDMQYMAKVSQADQSRLAGARYIVLVANHGFSTSELGSLNTLGDVRELVDKNVNLNIAGTKQSDGTCGFDDNILSQGILMMAEQEVTLDLTTNKDLGTVKLIRKISKISVIEPFVQIKGHDGPFRKEVALLNYTNRGVLPGNKAAGIKAVKRSSFISYNKTIDEHIFRGADFQTASIKYPLSFYTYYTEWNDKAEQLAVEIKLTDAKTKESYYYLVRIDPKKLNAEGRVIGTTNHTEPNVSYDVMAKITRLGSKDPYEPMVLDGNSVIVNEINWSNGENKILGGHYIYFDAPEVAMSSEDFQIGLHSSSRITELSIDKDELKYIVSGENYPTLIEEPADKESAKIVNASDIVNKEHKAIVKIHSTTPNNYCPKKIIINAKNENGESATLKIIHYPPRTVTMVKYKSKHTVRGSFNNWSVVGPYDYEAFKIRTYYAPNEKEFANIAYPQMYLTKFYDTFYYTRKPDPNNPLTEGDIDGKPMVIEDVLPDDGVLSYYIPSPLEKYSKTISPDFIVEAAHKEGDEYLSLDRQVRSLPKLVQIKFTSYADRENAQYYARYQMPWNLRPLGPDNDGIRRACLYPPLNEQEIHYFKDEENSEPIVFNKNWLAFAHPLSNWYDFIAPRPLAVWDPAGHALNRGDYSFVYCLRMDADNFHKAKSKGWRVPTAAEMKLILKIRNDQNWQNLFKRDPSKMSILLSKGAYWAADGSRYTYGLTKKGHYEDAGKVHETPDELYDNDYHVKSSYDILPKPLGFTRCVRDIRDDQAWK